MPTRAGHTPAVRPDALGHAWLSDGCRLRRWSFFLEPLLTAPPRPPPTPPRAQVKPPCAANATHEFTQASPDRNFVGAPAARKRLPSRSDHTECAARCEKLTAKAVAGGAGEAEGCVAFSVSVEPARPDTARAPRYCNLFTGSVPHRVCGEGDGQDLCAVASEGSYRIRFNAGA